MITRYAAVIAADANDSVAQRLWRDDVVAECVKVLQESEVVAMEAGSFFVECTRVLCCVGTGCEGLLRSVGSRRGFEREFSDLD